MKNQSAFILGKLAKNQAFGKRRMLIRFLFLRFPQGL
jgi:hypothetical protein